MVIFVLGQIKKSIVFFSGGFHFTIFSFVPDMYGIEFLVNIKPSFP